MFMGLNEMFMGFNDVIIGFSLFFFHGMAVPSSLRRFSFLVIVVNYT